MNIKEFIGKYRNLRADCALCSRCGLGDLEERRGYDADGISTWDFSLDPDEPLTIFFRAPQWGDNKTTPQENLLIADRLEQLLPQIVNDEAFQNSPDVGEYIQKLINGFRKAASLNEDVCFNMLK